MAGHHCSDHSYELALRRSLLLLLHLLELLRFVAAVLLDRLGVVSCPDEMLPGQTWTGLGDDAAMERLLEAAFWTTHSSPPMKKRSVTAPRVQHRQRRVAPAADGSGAEDDNDDDGGAGICIICLAELDVGGHRVKELRNCSHEFHAACIDAWIASGEAGTCPLCRTPMLPTAWIGWPEGAMRVLIDQ